MGLTRYLMRQFVVGERLWPTCDCKRQGKCLKNQGIAGSRFMILPKLLPYRYLGCISFFLVSNNSGFNQTNAVVLYEPLFMNIFYTWQGTSHAGVTEQPSLSWWFSARSIWQWFCIIQCIIEKYIHNQCVMMAPFQNWLISKRNWIYECCSICNVYCIRYFKSIFDFILVR